jgi:hypothetical protein
MHPEGNSSVFCRRKLQLSNCSSDLQSIEEAKNIFDKTYHKIQSNKDT